MYALCIYLTYFTLVLYMYYSTVLYIYGCTAGAVLRDHSESDVSDSLFALDTADMVAERLT